jgi:hypothetical protein
VIATNEVATMLSEAGISLAQMKESHLDWSGALPLLAAKLCFLTHARGGGQRGAWARH